MISWNTCNTGTARQVERTVSSACVYDDRTVAAAGASGSAGALFCASRAISAIRRRYVDDASGPNDTAWNETAFLYLGNNARQLEHSAAGKRQHLPKSDSGAAQILYDMIRDTTFSV